MPKTKPKPTGTTGQFTTTKDDEKRLTAFLEEKSRGGLDLSRAQAIALLFRKGLEAEGVRA